MSFISKDDLYTSSDIKREAKLQLKGHWRSAIFLTLIPVVIAIIFVGGTTTNFEEQSLFRDLVDILMNIAQSFFNLGVAFTLLDFIRNRNGFIEPLKGIFQAVQKKYFKGLLWLQIYKYIRIFLWTLLLIIPGIIKGYAYSQSDYIYKDIVDRTGEQPSAKECIQESEELMKGRKMSLFILQFSFIGWAILSVLTLGIGLIWLIPYMTMSEVVFYENAAGNQFIGPDPYVEESMHQENEQSTYKSHEEVGQDPDDFSDFEDF